MVENDIFILPKKRRQFAQYFFETEVHQKALCLEMSQSDGQIIEWFRTVDKGNKDAVFRRVQTWQNLTL